MIDRSDSLVTMLHIESRSLEGRDIFGDGFVHGEPVLVLNVVSGTLELLNLVSCWRRVLEAVRLLHLTAGPTHHGVLQVVRPGRLLPLGRFAGELSLQDGLSCTYASNCMASSCRRCMFHAT